MKEGDGGCLFISGQYMPHPASATSSFCTYRISVQHRNSGLLHMPKPHHISSPEFWIFPARCIWVSKNQCVQFLWVTGIPFNSRWAILNLRKQNAKHCIQNADRIVTVIQ